MVSEPAQSGNNPPQPKGQQMDWFDMAAITEFVRRNQEYAVPIVFVFALAESLAFISLIVPSTLILITVSGILGAAGVSIVPAMIAGSIGGVIGYALSYYVGLLFKDSIDTTWPFRTQPEMLAKGRAFFDRWGVWAVFLGHFFGPVRAVIPVLAGAAGMKHWQFQIANVPSATLWAVGVLSPALLGPWLGPLFGH